jgi:hypothetical protein
LIGADGYAATNFLSEAGTLGPLGLPQ